jgi:protein tyrosine/serine phosphatase
VIRKIGPSVFFGTPFATLLNEMDVDTLIITGTTTSGCVRASAVATMFALSLAIPAAAQNAAFNLSRVHIDNFGMVNTNYYRGAQPDGRDYDDLAALGVKTVIDLTQGERSDEQRMVERAGMTFYRIPLTTTERPSESALQEFLSIVNDPARQPVYVHCHGGQHRTGVMTAVYRMTEDGWSADRAYAEMKQFNFEGFPGHPTLKNFVYDYSAQIDRTHLAANHPAVETVATK